MALESFKQRLVQCHESTGIELLACLAERRRGHCLSQWLVMEYLEETTQFIGNAALAQVQQHGHQKGQRERSLAGEIRGVIAGRLRKLLGVQDFFYGRIKEFKFDR